MRKFLIRVSLFLVACAIAVSSVGSAQLLEKKGISLVLARKMIAAAQAHAATIKVACSVAVLDDHGTLIAFERMDDAAFSTTEVAVAKGRTAALFRRPSKSFQDRVRNGEMNLMTFPITASEGGVPVMVDGKVIGAIGTSGGTAEQDGEISSAGAAVVK